ncbi:hypothetical protein MSG28_008942 [Choristoneura fumiferana]|uniref:Uncharacterized protein n=1 Tax=Choristoneura fumiferana TaxID=7141 RepID=A0ACC0J8S3_CHOFU|nr:hypothetical protein MSG28_008942 [Choristoneura fumiferana]
MPQYPLSTYVTVVSIPMCLLMKHEINYDSPRGGVSVITEKGETTTSHLLVQRAKAPDSGRYTCAPANANPRSVLVHVLSGKY